MTTLIGEQTLANENRRFFGTGGRSEENAGLGFLPAFRNRDDGAVYRSCFADGRPAPFHLLDGLPEHLVVRGESGRVIGAKSALVSGFLLAGRFYTRDEAAAAVSGATAAAAAH